MSCATMESCNGDGEMGKKTGDKDVGRGKVTSNNLNRHRRGESNGDGQ